MAPDKDFEVRFIDGRRAWTLAVVFVAVTLAALVAIPIVVQRRVDEQRATIEDAEPARTLLMALQFNLVREMSSLNQYALTGHREHAGTFAEAQAAELDLWQRLAPLASALGPEVHERFVEARTIAQFWHQQLGRPELIPKGEAALPFLQSSRLRLRFQSALHATAALDSAIVQRTATSRERIQKAEREGLLLTFGSGALALLAAGVVAAMVLRIRRLGIVSERRRVEAAEALAESARVTEARRRLIRGITHDVKNPLGAARGYAELLAMDIKGSLNQEQKKLVEGVERSIDGALAIISDLLDLARADSGGISVHCVNVDLNEVVRNAVEDHQAAAVAAGHDLTMRESRVSLITHTDPSRVRQVLDNLISNAIKYTPSPGQIVVHTEADASDAPSRSPSVAIRVTDTGPGIPKDQRERIFDEFSRLDDGGSLKGHGLGLAIARRIARMLGGDLGVADNAVPGSTFVFWLPRDQQREQPTRAA